MIQFMKNENGVEMGNIGVVRYKAVEGYDLRQIGITYVVNRGERVRVQVYPQDRLALNKFNTGDYCYGFKKHKA